MWDSGSTSLGLGAVVHSVDPGCGFAAGPGMPLLWAKCGPLDPPLQFSEPLIFLSVHSFCLQMARLRVCWFVTQEPCLIYPLGSFIGNFLTNPLCQKKCIYVESDLFMYFVGELFYSIYGAGFNIVCVCVKNFFMLKFVILILNSPKSPVRLEQM